MRTPLLSSALTCALLLLTAGGQQAAAQEPERSWLGIGIDNGSAGVKVTQVFPMTPAFAAGLEEGDEIVAVARRQVASTTDLQSAIGARAPGSAVAIDVDRGGRRFRLSVVLETMPSHAERLARVLVDQRAPTLPVEPVAGPRVRDLTELRGRVTVMAFVTSWEEASRAAVDALTALAADHGAAVAVVAVSSEHPDGLRTFAGRINGQVSVVHDPGGRVGRAFLVEPQLQPQLVVVDARGVIRHAAALEGGTAALVAPEGRAPLTELIDGALFAARRELRRSARR